jgi:hypothetical protein
MNKIESLVDDLQEILSLVAKEISEGGLWSTELLNDVVKPEMDELLGYALKGEIYFKYGKKQRMLQSTYFMTDTFEKLDGTELGKKITALQRKYY